MERSTSEDEPTESIDLEINGVKFGVGAVREFLHRHELDVDENGFIIQQETGELATPYAFSRDAIKNHENPSTVDDRLAAFCVPESESTVAVGGKEKIHLSDLHTVYEIDGKARPIRDHGMAIRWQMDAIGGTFSHITEWSDCANILDESNGKLLIIRSGPDESIDPITFNCFRCDHSSHGENWIEEHDDESGLEHRCPECDALWDINRLYTCTHCQETHTWEEQMEETSDGGYWEPFCPNCNADGDALHVETRYRGANEEIENAPEPTIKETDTDISDRHFDKAREIDNQFR